MTIYQLIKLPLPFKIPPNVLSTIVCWWRASRCIYGLVVRQLSTSQLGAKAFAIFDWWSVEHSLTPAHTHWLTDRWMDGWIARLNVTLLRLLFPLQAEIIQSIQVKYHHFIRVTMEPVVTVLTSEFVESYHPFLLITFTPHLAHLSAYTWFVRTQQADEL